MLLALKYYFFDMKATLVTSELLEKEHSRYEQLVFFTKSTILSISRGFTELFKPISKHAVKDQLIDAPIIAVSSSKLWNKNDTQKNWILTAGKIENLRIAVKEINGIEIEANQIFSFWKQIGNPNFFKGFVAGREIREGCLVATKGGGLCQLSNALYDAAMKANCNIIERHRHTKVIKGSLAEKDRDATIKWRYVDLKFSSDHKFRIEAELTANSLIVIFKSFRNNTSNFSSSNFRVAHQINDCYSCGNLKCHQSIKTDQLVTSKTTFLLNGHSLHLLEQLNKRPSEFDLVITSKKENSIKSLLKLTKPDLLLRLVYKLSRKGNVFHKKLNLDRNLAKKMSQRIPIESTHLVISQNLIPHLMELGILGGRTFDIIMNTLPLDLIHNKLNKAYTVHYNSRTLSDFRADQKIVDFEKKGLEKASKIYGIQSSLVDSYPDKFVQIPIEIPHIEHRPTNNKRPKILFPSLPIARNGVYLVTELKSHLEFDLMVTKHTINEEPDLWNSIEKVMFDGDYSKIDLVVLPSYIENYPHYALKSLSKGVPVICSKSSSLSENDNPLIFKLKSTEFEEFKELTTKILSNLNYKIY